MNYTVTLRRRELGIRMAEQRTRRATKVNPTIALRAAFLLPTTQAYDSAQA